MNHPVVKAMSDIAVRLTVSPAPHWRSRRTVHKMMQAHLLALMPAIIMAIYIYGLQSLAVVGLSGSVAVMTEALCRKTQKRPLDIDNWTALYDGILFAFLLPVTAPWWLVSTGAVLTITLGRNVFGGFGSNPVCAPLVAWALCQLSWPEAMDMDLNLVAFLTNDPLAQLKYFGASSLSQLDYMGLFLGKQLGGLGASQVLALLAGGTYLLCTGWVRAYIPTGFLLGVAATSTIFWLIDPAIYADPMFHLLAGSTIFGAFFLAPDEASSPVGMVSQFCFGIIAGILVVIIRVYGIYPDGVPFAIMLANLLSPLLDKIRPKPFGGR